MPRRVGVDMEKRIKRQDAWRKENLDRCYLYLPKGKKAEWKAMADAENKSLNEWIIDKVESRD